MSALKRFFLWEMWSYERWAWNFIGAPEWTPTYPNSITLFRGRLSFFGICGCYFALLAYPASKWLALAMLTAFVTSWLLDLVDGAIAKCWNMKSESGKCLDPSSDALNVFYGLIPVLLYHGAPSWVTVPMIVFTTCGLLILRLRIEEGVETHALAKCALACIYVGVGVSLASVVAGTYELLPLFVVTTGMGAGCLVVGCVAMTASTAVYYWDDIKLAGEYLPRWNWSSLF